MKCCVTRCDTSTETDHHLLFYTLPCDEERSSVWLKNMKYAKAKADLFLTPIIVCSLHFLDGKLSERGTNPTIFPWSKEWPTVTVSHFKRKFGREYKSSDRDTVRPSTSQPRNSTLPLDTACTPSSPQAINTHRPHRFEVHESNNDSSIQDHDYCKVSSLFFMDEITGQWRDFYQKESVLSCVAQYNKLQRKDGSINSPSSVSSLPLGTSDTAGSLVEDETDDEDEGDEDPAVLLAKGKTAQLMKLLRKYRRKNEISSSLSEEHQSLPGSEQESEEHQSYPGSEQQYECSCGRFTTTSWTLLQQHQEICLDEDSSIPAVKETTSSAELPAVLTREQHTSIPNSHTSLTDENPADELHDPLNISGWSDAWSAAATLALIESCRYRKNDFKDPGKKKCIVWRLIANELQEQGYAVKGIHCKRKMEALKKRYKAMKDRTIETGQDFQRSWLFFQAMDKLMIGNPTVEPIELRGSLLFGSRSSSATAGVPSPLTSAHQQFTIPAVSPCTAFVLNCSPSPSPSSALEDATSHSLMEPHSKRQKMEGTGIISHALLQSQDKLFGEFIQTSKEWNTTVKEFFRTLRGKLTSQKVLEQWQRENKELQQKYGELHGLLLKEKDKHVKQIKEMRENHFKEIKEIVQKHKDEMNALQDQHQEQLMELKLETYA